MVDNRQIIFENKDLFALYKPHGEHTLSSSNSQEDKSLCLYRLDECTSGILVYAKSQKIYDYLKELQKENKIVKTYRAFTNANSALLAPNAVIDEYRKQLLKSINKYNPLIIGTYFRPFGKNRRAVRAVFDEELKILKNKDITKNKYYSTILEVKEISAGSKLTEFKVEITKGFRHQIRVHLATLGFPIVGDTMYGYHNQIDVYTHSISLECIEISIGDTKISYNENADNVINNNTTGK